MSKIARSHMQQCQARVAAVVPLQLLNLNNFNWVGFDAAARRSRRLAKIRRGLRRESDIAVDFAHLKDTID